MHFISRKVDRMGVCVRGLVWLMQGRPEISYLEGSWCQSKARSGKPASSGSAKPLQT